jgi:hypothetical protein
MSERIIHPSLAALSTALRFPLPEQGPPLDIGFAHALAVWILESTAPWPDAFAPLMGELLTLHRRDMAGDVPTPAEWQRARQQTRLLEDGGDELLEALIRVAEAASWPVSAGKSGLTELHNAAGTVHSCQASRATGWTVEDNARAITLLNQLAAGHDGHRPAREDVPGLFAKAAPDLEPRFVRQLNAANNAFTQFCQTVRDRLVTG